MTLRYKTALTLSSRLKSCFVKAGQMNKACGKTNYAGSQMALPSFSHIRLAVETCLLLLVEGKQMDV